MAVTGTILDMVRQQFYIQHYWKVVVWYNLDYSLFDAVAEEMMEAGFPERKLRKLWLEMKSRRAKAATFSNTQRHISIVLFNRHQSWTDYLNSLVHEAEHVKQAMLKAYRVRDEGEAPAYTVGYLVKKMWEGFRRV